ncbi:MAG: hypothetical protein K8T20_03215 [Planctomycetes bacterium]|nr:hypothetical protein [Planctomycetota bacterium]
MSIKGAKDAASTRKAVRNLVKSLQRRYKPNHIKHGKSSTEHLVYVILAQKNPERRAAAAMHDISAQFAGWNEVRVSSVLEIGDVLKAHNVLNPLQKAEQIIRSLGRTFSDAHKFKLEDLTRDDAEDTRVYMARKLGLPAQVVADYLFSAFGYSKLPVDDTVGRLLFRLGHVELKHEFPKLEKTLSEGITTREASDSYRVLEAFASEVCLEKDPACARCPLFADCPDGQARKAAAEAAKLAPPPPPPPPVPETPAPAPKHGSHHGPAKPGAPAHGTAKPGFHPPAKAASGKPVPKLAFASLPTTRAHPPGGSSKSKR